MADQSLDALQDQRTAFIRDVSAHHSLWSSYQATARLLPTFEHGSEPHIKFMDHAARVKREMGMLRANIGEVISACFDETPDLEAVSDVAEPDGIANIAAYLKPEYLAAAQHDATIATIGTTYQPRFDSAIAELN